MHDGESYDYFLLCNLYVTHEIIHIYRPLLRKSIHKKSASHDIVREMVKIDGASVREAEMKTMRGFSVTRETSSSSESSWIPHEVTGIYYPKGQEKVMQDVPPPPAGSHAEELVNWFS